MSYTSLVLLSLYLLVNVAINAQLVSDIQEDDLNSQQEILLNSGKFEGDILLSATRNGLKNPIFRWPNKVVPYVLDSSYTPQQARWIHQVVQEIGKRTCVQVIPKRSFDKDYIYVTGRDKNKCYSNVGRQGGVQIINLCPMGCLSYKIIIHEFLHAIGFHHEHNNINRDKYIQILWNNMEAVNFHNFYKYDFLTNFGLPYDYGSIMHYYETAFSKNGLPTIVPYDPKWKGRVGMSQAMTQTDIAKVNAMYGCKI
nr:zinc metalloproteinase nas-7-like [Onthophagus taurus]